MNWNTVEIHKTQVMSLLQKSDVWKITRRSRTIALYRVQSGRIVSKISVGDATLKQKRPISNRRLTHRRCAV